MSKKQENLFPGPGPNDKIIVRFINQPGPEGKVIGIFDDAYIVEAKDGTIVVCMKHAIESVWVTGEAKE